MPRTKALSLPPIAVIGVHIALGSVGLLSLSSCAGGGHASRPPEATGPEAAANTATGNQPPEEVAIHPGESWFAYRADGLGLSVDEAKERDAKLGKTPPQGRFWDAQVATEAWGLWTELCSQCHGGSRKLNTVQSWPQPEEDWATKDRRFFGRRARPSEIFSTILTGARAKRGNVDMPSWRGRLTHEQMWSMVYFIAQASDVGDVR